MFWSLIVLISGRMLLQGRSIYLSFISSKAPATEHELTGIPKCEVINDYPSMCYNWLASSFKPRGSSLYSQHVFGRRGGEDSSSAYFIVQTHIIVQSGWKGPEVGDQGACELSRHFRFKNLFS